MTGIQAFVVIGTRSTLSEKDFGDLVKAGD
jgi:hypothetical protein